MSLANLGKETVRGLMVHAMVEVIRVNYPQAILSVLLGNRYAQVLSKCRSSDTTPLILARVTQDIAEVSTVTIIKQY